MANENHLELTPEAFIGTCRFLMKNIVQALVKAEAARMLIIQHGVCFEADFEKMEAYVQKYWDEMTSKVVSEAAAQADDEATRPLLETLKLTPQ